MLTNAITARIMQMWIAQVAGDHWAVLRGAAAGYLGLT
jgi:hypothetical protein